MSTNLTGKFLWYEGSAWRILYEKDNYIHVLNYWDLLKSIKISKSLLDNQIDNKHIAVIEKNEIIPYFINQLKKNLDISWEGNLWTHAKALAIENKNRMELTEYLDRCIKTIPSTMLNCTKKGISILQTGTDNFTFATEVPGNRPCSDGQIYKNPAEYASYLLQHKPIDEYFREAYPGLEFQASAPSPILPSILCIFPYTPPTNEKLML